MSREITIRSWTSSDKQGTWEVLKEASYSNVYPSFSIIINRRASWRLVFVISSICLIYYQSIFILISFLCIYTSVVFILTFLATLFYLYGPPLSDMQDVYKNYLNIDEDNHFWVAECDGEIAGTIAIVKKENLLDYQKTRKIAWLRRMAVKKKFRRLGIAKKLVEKTIEFCNNHNYNVIELITTEVHKPARKLYRSVGFVQVNFEPYQYLNGLIKIWTYEFVYIL